MGMKKATYISKHGFVTTKQRSALMSKIVSRNTGPEKIFRGILKKCGKKYSTKTESIIGKPDFILRDHKLAIFIDGEFWHGYRWSAKKARLVRNKAYWESKIESNMRRDRRVSRTLKTLGWSVLRFWSSDVRLKPESCIKKIFTAIGG